MSFNLTHVETVVQSQVIRYLDHMMALKLLTKKVVMMLLILLLTLVSVQVYMVSAG